MSTTSRVYQYGAVPTRQFPKEGNDSLFQANQVWNRLVEAHNRSRDRLESARAAADAEYALIADSIRLADAAVDSAYMEKRKARAKAGTKDSTHPLIVEANAVIKVREAERVGLWAQAKAARKRADAAIDRKELDKAFVNECNAAVRVESTDGMGSDSAVAVLGYFKTARREAFKSGGKLQFHRFDGTGFLFFRFRLKGSTMDGVPFSWLMSSGEKDDRPFVFTGRTEAKKPRLHLRVKVAGGRSASSKVYAYFDVILHRPVPEGAQVQHGMLLRRRTGDRFRYLINLTLRLPAVQPQPLAPASLGIDIGFRLNEDGSIRVGMVGGSHATDGFEELVLPKEILDQLDHIDAIKGSLADSAAALGLVLKPLMRPIAENEEHKFNKLARSVANMPALVTLSFEKAYKMGRIAQRDPEAFGEQATDVLVSWISANGRRYREMHNLRAKALRRRKHLYRNYAARIVAMNRPIGIESLDLRRFAETRDSDNKLGNAVRARRFRASVSELLEAIRNAAQRQGLRVVEVSAAYTSKTCSDCDAVNRGLEADKTWTCRECGTIHDRDENATVNIARRTLEILGLPLGDHDDRR